MREPHHTEGRTHAFGIPLKRESQPLKPCAWEVCRGEAHSNPHIDHCGICMPSSSWGGYPVCVECCDADGNPLRIVTRGNGRQRHTLKRPRCRQCGVVYDCTRQDCPIEAEWTYHNTNEHLPGEFRSCPTTLIGLLKRAEAGITMVRMGDLASWRPIEAIIREWKATPSLAK